MKRGTFDRSDNSPSLSQPRPIAKGRRENRSKNVFIFFHKTGRKSSLCTTILFNVSWFPTEITLHTTVIGELPKISSRWQHVEEDEDGRDELVYAMWHALIGPEDSWNGSNTTCRFST